jgi:tetratricopeptide (TPR) repeat protein
MILPVGLLLSVLAFGQAETIPPSENGPGQTEGPPRSPDDTPNPNESSSKATKIDIAPPEDDAKNHPKSTTALEDAGSNGDADVQEMHPFDPFKAGKDDEVGLFYFKQKNYKAALARYQDALKWKDNDAEANFKIAECQEKLNNPSEAALHYQAYLKILPHGPYAKDAQKALSKLKARGIDAEAQAAQ